MAAVRTSPPNMARPPQRQKPALPSLAHQQLPDCPPPDTHLGIGGSRTTPFPARCEWPAGFDADPSPMQTSIGVELRHLPSRLLQPAKQKEPERREENTQASNLIPR